MRSVATNIRPFWLVVPAVAVGAFLRLYALAVLPISSGFDVAYYGLDALQILDGQFPIYLETNFGREALYSYLVAALYAGLGLSDFAIRLAAAFAGILTIPANYIVAQELLRFAPQHAVRRYGPVFAAWVLATMYWHLVWSRYGVRAILAPLFVALAMFFLLRAQRLHRRRDYLLAGLTAGLALHSYQIGQLLPFLMLGTIMLDYWSRRPTSLGSYLRPFGSLLAAFLVLAVPLGLYALANPQAFNQRVRDVAVVETAQPLAAQAQTLIERGAILLRFLTVRGDTHNMWSVADLPGLNPFLLAGFAGGLLIILWAWRQRLAQVMWLWLLVMLAPAVLAGSGAVSKRALGVLPLLATLIALAFTAAVAWLSRRNTRNRFWPAAGALVVIGGLLFTLARTYYQYFVVWGTDELQVSHFEPQLSEVGTFIATLPAEERIYLSADAPNHPNMLLHSRLRTAGETVRGYNGWRCFVYPEVTVAPTTYVLSDDPSIESVQTAFPTGQWQTENLSDRYGYQDHYMAYRVPKGVPAALTPPIPAENGIWGDEQIKLLGYGLSEESVAPGERLTVTLYWQALQAVDARYTVFLHLIGETNPATGNVLWAQQDNEPCTGYYPTAVWRPGEIIRDEMVLEIAPDTPPGTYELFTGLYTWPDFQRLPLAAEDTFRIGSITVR